MIVVPESEAIIKRPGFRIRELELPVQAAIRGFVNSRLPTGTDAEHVGPPLVKSMDIAKVELVRSCNGELVPMLAAVYRAQNSSVGAAGPRHFIGDSANASKLNVSAAVLVLPLGEYGDTAKRQNEA